MMRMIQKINILIIAFLTVSFLIFFSVKLIDLLDVRVVLLIRTVLIIIDIYLACWLFNIYIIRVGEKPNGLRKNLLLLVFCLIYFFLIFECIFMFIPKSNAFQGTLASRVWFSYYWGKANRLKYRSAEIIIEHTKKNILVVGDSFVVGVGIKNTRDRFSDLLNKNLPEFKVYNLGRNGADTRSEFKNLNDYPVEPDMVILQYFGNDIDCPGTTNTITLYSDVNKIIGRFINHSFLFNYIYWQFPHYYTYQDYFQAQISCYRNELIFNQHLSELNKFIVFSRQKKIPLIVVIFPFLTDIESSRVYTEKIKQFFIKEGIEVLNVADIVKKMPIKDRIVNLNDPHPSILVNKLIAEELCKIIRNNKTLNVK